ncbi:hypothetical protein [Kineothrix sp. MB12-C1]|uniref:hypothetical protein n=1 Tax=Kineothrix sp. MB12-C1 TaxID=3070215 RepID=UPI0027D2ACD9|nr:hypothetical protein [Kineothrix sp. MB12-C1]WMC91112.1 hypothetical protein RBB56_09440 [Kineothrix sp. MB12-C1]
MDISSLKPGDDFSELHPNYVIFICAFDPFGLGLYRYTFENRCLERGFPLGDETTKIFLNTKGKNAEEVPDVLVNFLKYLEDSTDESVKELQDQTIEHLHHRVTAVKRNREWEGQYMTIEEFIQDSARAVCEEACEEARKEAHKEGLLEGREEGREEGRAEGRAEGCVEGREEGQEEMLQLIRHMTEAGESEQIFRLTQDRTFFEEMYQKYIILRNK